MLNIIRDIYDNICFFECVNILVDFIGHIFAVILFIRSILVFNHNRQVKHIFCKNDLKSLRYYVATYAEFTPPYYGPDLNKEIKKFDLINFFINDVFKKDNYGKYFIVLAESGMGKSTFLQMLFIKYQKKILKRYKMYFYPLTNNIDTNDWKNIKHKNNCILLLDALDEDSLALKNCEDRIKQITEASLEFYKVIITCRTQFFSNEQNEPQNTSLINYDTKSKKLKFHKIYISKFDNNDINTFLKKHYRFKKNKINQAKNIINKCADLMARPMILAYIDDLLKNPEIHSCISDIYNKLIDEWLNREPVNYEILKHFTNCVMRYMFDHNVFFVSEDTIAVLCKKDEIDIINPILARTRSLLTRNNIGEYSFAHKSIFEYLISYEAIYNDTNIRKKLLISEKYIDLKFYQEMSFRQVKQNNNNLTFLDLRNTDLRYNILNNVTLIGANLSNANLFGINLSGSDLSNTIFSNTDLSHANLTHADLSNTDLSNSLLNNAILTYVNLSNANLSGKDLTGINLSNAILNGTNLTYTNLTGANLSNTDLGNSLLNNIILTDANLSNVNLSNMNLFGMNFAGIDLSGANLTNCILKNTNLIYTDLTYANLSGVDLSNTELNNTILKDTDLTHANLTGASLSDTNLSNALLNNATLAGAILSNTNLSNVNLSDADLSDIILKNVNLTDTILTHSNLSNVNLSNINLSDKNLIGINLSNASLSNASLNNTNLTNANLIRTNLTHANLSNANLIGVNLSYADLNKAILKNVNLTDADLIGVNLSYVDLSNAILKNVNLTDADLTGANLTSVDLSNAILNGINLTYANLSNVNLSAMNLSNIDLSYANLKSTNLKGVILKNTITKGTIISFDNIDDDALLYFIKNHARLVTSR